MGGRPLVVRILGEADFSKAQDAVSKFGKVAGGLALGAGVAAAGGLAAGFQQALSLEKAQDQLAAQLGLTGAAAAEAGQIAGDLYSSAYGESLEEVTSAVQSTFAAFPDTPPDVLKELTRDSLDMAAAFEGSADEYIALAKQLESQGVTDSAGAGLDFLTTAFQELPSQLQGPLTDAVSEYGVFLDSLGFSTAETFDILTQAAGDGEFALDKTGDALKEFGIRATDLSTASVDAFNTIGLDAQVMGEQILAGGDTAKGAFDGIIDGLLAIEDPVLQANSAIALFGTPLEDLGVNEIPDFLASLDETTGAFEDVAGAAMAMGDELKDNLATRLETLKRRGLAGLATVAEAVVVPAIERVLDVFGRVSAVASDAFGIFQTAFAVFSGDESQRGAFFENLGTPLGRFVSQVARVAVEVKEIFSGLFSTISGLFGGDGGGGGLRETFDSLLSAITPLVTAFGDFLTVLNTGEGYEDFNQTAVRIAQAVREFASVLINDVIPAVAAFISELAAFGERILPRVLPVLQQIGEILAEVFTVAIAAVEAFVEVAPEVWSRWGDEILAVAEAVFTTVLGVIGGALDVILGTIRLVMAIAQGDWSAAWEGIKQILSGAWDIMRAVVRLALDAIQVVFRIAIAGLRVAWTTLWNTLRVIVSSAWERIKAFVRNGADNVVSAIRGLPGRIASAAVGMFDGIIDAFRGVLNRIRDLWSGLNLSIPEVNIPGVGSVGGGSLSGLVGRIPFFEQGGVVTEPTLGVLAEVPNINRNNPEIISPKDQMIDALMQALQMTGGQGQSFAIEQIVVQDGRDLESTFDRLARRAGVA